MTPGSLPNAHRPRFSLALSVCTLSVIANAGLRLWFLRRHLAPAADCLILLIFLWARYRRLLWGMAVCLTVTSLLRLYVIQTFLVPEPPAYVALSAGSLTINILLTTAVLHLLLNFYERLEQKNEVLEHTNAELEAANVALSQREEEIQRQNKELHLHTEALARQGAELTELNSQLGRREQTLEALLDSSRWLRTDLDQHAVLSRICEVALKVMGGDAHAVAIVHKRDDRLLLRGCAGLGPEGPSRQSWPYEHSFAAIVMEQNRTGFLADVSLCPEMEVLQPLAGAGGGPHFQSLLATPFHTAAVTTGAVVIYSLTPRQWNEKTFKVVEWLAAQLSLVIEAVDLQVQLDHRRRQAEEASQRKTRFLAAVSHDVRTPANAINLMAELISRAVNAGIPPEEIAELARDLQTSARLLVELVSDVLDLARFDSASLDLQTDDFALWPVICAEVKQLLPLAQEHSLRLSANLPSTPVWLRTDRMKLARIFGNLIGNAIKFTISGGAEVRGAEMPDGSIEVRVVDTGIGIAPEHLADIFDEFFQLRNPARDRCKGTGLGLAICKRLVAAIGCTISLESTPGKGSTFTLRIPASLRIATPSRADAAASHKQAHGRLAGLRILLVEDHEMTRRATAKILAAEGATVMQAEHGRAAMHILAHDFPQVLLLDLMLPDIDGSEILRRLQADRPASLKCMLAVSGDVSAGRVREVQSLGAHALIPKPVDLDVLVNAITTSMPAGSKALAPVRA